MQINSWEKTSCTEKISLMTYSAKKNLRPLYIYIYILLLLLLLLIARKLTFEYDQMRVTSKIPKNYKQKQ